jgi:predicted transglutaminase-like cysteine proteinase
MVRKRRSTTKVAVAMATLLCVCAASGVAVAGSRADAAPAMPLGGAAPMPQGFIDLCRQSPDQCPATGPMPDFERLAAENNRQRWRAIFGLAETTQPPAASAPSAGPVLMASTPIVRLVPRLRPVSATPVVPGAAVEAGGALSVDDIAEPAVEVDGQAMAAGALAAEDASAPTIADSVIVEPSAEAVSADGAATFALDREGWRTVNRINRRLNREVRHVEDQTLYGQPDLWAMPLGARGDCEDYVLAKRAALIAEGVPAEALSVAIVETTWGETHAVLLLASDRGEYVLDNLSPWVSRWDRVDYRWRERQAPGRPFDWVAVAL